MLVENVQLSPALPRQIRVLVAAGKRGAEAQVLLRELLPSGAALRRLEGVNGREGRSAAIFGRVGSEELEVPLAEARHNLSAGQIAVLPQSGDWREGKLYFPEGTLEWIPVPGTEREVNVDVPLIRLHRPDEQGCEAKYAIAGEESGTGSAKFTLGVSVGGEASFDAKATETYTATDSCIEVSVPVALGVALHSLRVDGQEIRRDWDANILDVAEGKKDPHELPRAENHCGEPFKQASLLPNFQTWDLGQAGDPDLETEIEFERTSKATLGLDLGDSIKLELGIERTTTHTTTVTTTVVKGHRYSVYVPSTGNTLERCWTTR